MDPNQFYYFTNGNSQSAAFPADFIAENTAGPSSSSANRSRARQPRPSQQPETSQQPKRQRTEAPGWQLPSDQNPPFTAQNDTRPFLYQFQATLTKVYLSEQQYQAALSRMKDFTDKPSLVEIMESMAEKLVHVDGLQAPRRTLNLFPTEPSSFRPAAEDRGERRE